MKNELVRLGLSILLGACGQIILKISTKSLGGIDLSLTSLLPTLLKMFTNGWVLAGIFCFATSMVLWLKVLSTMELSRVQPTIALSYVLIFLFSVIFFKEQFTASKLFGILSIVLGVVVLLR